MAHQQIGEAGTAAGRQPGEQVEGGGVAEWQDVHEPGNADAVGEREGVRAERALRHPLVDEVVAFGHRLVPEGEAQDREPERAREGDRERGRPALLAAACCGTAPRGGDVSACRGHRRRCSQLHTGAQYDVQKSSRAADYSV